MTVGNKNEMDAGLEMTHELAQQDRFTRPHFSGDEHETFLGFDSMDQRGQTLEVVRVTVKKTRIGRYAERHFSKTEVAFKHRLVFLSPGKFDHLLTLLMKAVFARANFRFCVR